MKKSNLSLILEKHRPKKWKLPNSIKCKKCGDSGWIIVDGRNHRCECLIAEIKASKRKCLPIKYQHVSYKDIQKGVWDVPGSKSNQKITTPDIIQNHKGGVLLFSNKTCGKTQLLCAQYNAIVDRGFLNVFYVTEGRLLDDLQHSAYREDYQPYTPLWKIYHSEQFHLVIDNIGSTPITADRASRFYSLIDYFYSNDLSLSIATRYRFRDLERQWASVGVAGLTDRFKSLTKLICMVKA